MKLKKKNIFFLLLILFLLYALWLGFNILKSKTYKVTLAKATPLEIQGVYHIHTTFSDGTKDLDEIVKIASSADLDFIILTDHGRPNYDSYSRQGWKEEVLVLAGSELSVSRGHLVGLDFELPTSRFSQNAEIAVYQINAKGGFTIICHPYSKVQWSWGKFIDYSGIEIINADSMLKKDILLSLPYLPALLIKPEYALLKILDSPHRNLRKWDELNKIHPIYGYFSTDAHRLYQPAFDFLRLHLLLKTRLSTHFETARYQVYETLKRGRFYNSIHAAAHAGGFRFWGEKRKKMIPMGGSTLLDYPVKLHIKAPFSFSKEIHLVHNGKNVFQSSEENSSYETALPGTYRVEVYLRERTPLAKNVPWIVSNPIFLREAKK